MNDLPPKVRQLVAKVSRLMKEGATQGEKLAARKALERIADTHGLSVEDLGFMDDRTLHLVPIPKYDENMRSLSLLVIRKYFPDGELSRAGKNHQEKWELWNIMLSELDYAVCMQLLMDYSIAYDKHRQEAFIAWINVNGLVFPKEGETSEEPLDEVTLAKIRAQAKLVEKVNVNKKLK